MYDRVRVDAGSEGTSDVSGDRADGSDPLESSEAVAPMEPAGSVEEETTEIVGPVAARLPVGMDIVARPFHEPLLFRIAAAYEAATGHRESPPGFGPLDGEP